MARHMKPINRGPASAQGYGEASPLSHKATARQVPRMKTDLFAREASNALSLQYRSPPSPTKA
jgi:hypothetical protein